MKKWILITVTLWQAVAIACPVCQRQQPKILQGIVHGQGPDNSWDYMIVLSVAIITLITLILAVKWLLKPGEKNKTHIKYSILNKD